MITENDEATIFTDGKLKYFLYFWTKKATLTCQLEHFGILMIYSLFLTITKLITNENNV